MVTLYLMMGYPGAGKTTAAQALQQLTGAVHLSSDFIRLELFPSPGFSPSEHNKLYEHLDNLTEKLLSQGKSVIYDANLNRLIHRQQKYAICKKLGVKTVLIWVQTPKDIAKSRARHTQRSHLVPRGETAEQMFDRIASVIEQPLPNEPYVAIDGTKISPEYINSQLFKV